MDFLIIVATQPLLRQKALEFGRRRGLIRLEKKRSFRVIIMVHRQETMAMGRDEAEKKSMRGRRDQAPGSSPPRRHHATIFA